MTFITSIALGRELFSFDVQQIPQGTGSGFVWDRVGRVVTLTVMRERARREVRVQLVQVS